MIGWESIDENDCPRWVQQWISHNPSAIMHSREEHKYYLLRGHHFEYRVEGTGSQGSYPIIQRRRVK